METYPTYTYPDSGNSSPRSRDIDLENTPPSWEDSSSNSTLPSNHKVKFMVSYNGKIQPRSHDNLLSYVGGETKILAVDRGVKFNFIYSKLSSLAANSFDSEVGFTFKYQLPGEDLDALISVTNDDDLENMMSEYDRMWKGSNKPARLRLFLFPPVRSSSATSLPRTAYSSVNSESARMDPDPDTNDHPNRIIRSEVVSDVLDVVSPPPPPPVQAPVPVHNNVDFLFGLDKGPVHVNNVPVLKANEPESVHHQQIPVQGFQQFHLQQQLQNQLHLQQQQQQSAMFPSKNDENFADPYQKSSSPANVPGNNPANFPVPPGYWQQIDHHQQQQQNFPPQQPPQQPPQLQHQQYHTQQPVYMMHAPPPAANTYHTPQMMRPNQGFYQQPVFHNIPAPAAVQAVSTTAAQVRPVGESTGYAPVAYDSATGRQVYYAAGPQGGVIAPPPFPGMTAVTTMAGGGEMRGSGDGNVVPKIVSSQATV